MTQQDIKLNVDEKLKNIEKFFIFKLFGAGYCNQLFSLETAIYLSNILKRKLILWVRFPLEHIGHSTWDYGNILDFFSDDYKQYLKYGFEVYYKTLPKQYEKIAWDKNTRQISDKGFSSMVFVDKQFYLRDNMLDIENFARKREIICIDWDNDFNEQYIFTNKSNASRCFYNFYTTKENYLLMENICESLTKYNSAIINAIKNIKFDSIFNAIHFRFGDPNDPITRLEVSKYNYYEDQFVKNISNNDPLIIMTDRKNTPLLNNIEDKFKIIYIEDLISDVNIDCSHNNAVWEFLILMEICSKAEIFYGTNKSTVSNYIQYLRYLKNKSAVHYFNNPANLNICIKTNKNYPWIECNYPWHGHSIAWNVFWGTRKDWNI